jgi:hypothetical protein
MSTINNLFGGVIVDPGFPAAAAELHLIHGLNSHILEKGQEIPPEGALKLGAAVACPIFCTRRYERLLHVWPHVERGWIWCDGVCQCRSVLTMRRQPFSCEALGFFGWRKKRRVWFGCHAFKRKPRESYALIKKKTTIIARIGLVSPTLKHRRPQSESPVLSMTPVCAIIELNKVVIWWMSVDMVSSVKCQQKQI